MNGKERIPRDEFWHKSCGLFLYLNHKIMKRLITSIWISLSVLVLLPAAVNAQETTTHQQHHQQAMENHNNAHNQAHNHAIESHNRALEQHREVVEKHREAHEKQMKYHNTAKSRSKNEKLSPAVQRESFLRRVFKRRK
jgi:uncharacterized membrane protein YhiD involved in acid resistance